MTQSRHSLALRLLALAFVLLVPVPGWAQQETLQLAFTTNATQVGGPGGELGPFLKCHVVAWLEELDGRYVRTLARWGRNYWYCLRDWQAASGFDPVDGVSGASPAAYGPMSFTADVTGVPDGTYNLQLELSDWELPRPGQNNRATFRFVKDGQAASTSLPDQGGFSALSLSYSGRSAGSDYAPGVHAGSDRVLTLPATLLLAGAASDDGGPPGLTWSKQSGPGDVTFGDPAGDWTYAAFSLPGRYLLRLTADDGTHQSFDEAVVEVNATVVAPTADAPVTSNQPASNFGSTFRVFLNDTTQALLRFDLTGLPGAVVQAVLRLATCEGGYTTVNRVVRRVADDGWGEMNITFNNRPTRESTDYGQFPGTVGWTEAPLTQLVQGESAGDQLLSVNLDAVSFPSQWLGIMLRESYVGPRLLVYTAAQSVANTAPAAEAGPDQIVSDTDGDGLAPVDLDGRGSSDAEDNLLSFAWREGGNLFSIGVRPHLTLPVGGHLLELTVTDSQGGAGTDQVQVTVTEGGPTEDGGVNPDEETAGDEDEPGTDGGMIEDTAGEENEPNTDDGMGEDTGEDTGDVGVDDDTIVGTDSPDAVTPEEEGLPDDEGTDAISDGAGEQGDESGGDSAGDQNEPGCSCAGGQTSAGNLIWLLLVFWWAIRTAIRSPSGHRR